MQLERLRGSLDPEQVFQSIPGIGPGLARAIRRVTRQAYRTGGITNDRERAAALKKRGLRRAEYRHHVFARGGRRCWSCRSIVERAELGGRKIFFCPGCQAAS